jgi:hypothetical protein
VMSLPTDNLRSSAGRKIRAERPVALAMDLVRMLRALWQRRALLGLVSVLAVAAGVGIMMSSGTTKVGTAHAMALVDTPNSQVVDLGGAADDTSAGIVTLSNRATLLTGLMTSSPLTEEIAARAGISPKTLIAQSAVTQATTGSSATGTAAPVGASQLSGLSPLANVLSATVPTLSTGQVPIITVDTQSPTAEGAAKLADSSIAVLSEYLRSTATRDKVPGGRRVILRQLGPAVTSTTTNAPSKLLALGATAGVFLLGCALILGLSALKTGWRRAGEMEEFEATSGQGQELAPPAGEVDNLAASWLRSVPTAPAAVNGTQAHEPDDESALSDTDPSDDEALDVDDPVVVAASPRRAKLPRPGLSVQWRTKRPPSTPG